MRLHFGAAVFLLIPHLGHAQTPPPCEQAAFASAVSEVSAILSAMNDENRKAFQAKLLTLKTREGWSDGDYAAKATPFVKDATTASLDEGNKAILQRVPQLGGAADASGTPPVADAARRCAMLDELRGMLALVVDNTRAKWTHMLGKLDTALDVSRQAKAAR